MARKGHDKPSGEAAEKKHKNFVDDKNTALRLAETVAVAQEAQANKKVERQHQLATATKPKKKTASKSERKKRLDEVKTALAERAARAKREKAKSRKHAKAGADQESLHDATPKSNNKGPRKRVSFAG